MRAYTVTASLPAEDKDEKFIQYAGTQADAGAIKNNLWDEYRDSTLKRSEIEIEEVEIPTDKKGLISWINDNVR